MSFRKEKLVYVISTKLLLMVKTEGDGGGRGETRKRENYTIAKKVNAATKIFENLPVLFGTTKFINSISLAYTCYIYF